MRKILSLVLLLSLSTILVSCEMDEETKRVYREKWELKEELLQRRKILEQEIKKTSYQLDNPHVKEFQWKGHDMVLLQDGYGDHAVGGAFHDPECRKCHPIKSISTRVEEPEELSDYEKMFGKYENE